MSSCLSSVPSDWVTKGLRNDFSEELLDFTAEAVTQLSIVVPTWETPVNPGGGRRSKESYVWDGARHRAGSSTIRKGSQYQKWTARETWEGKGDIIPASDKKEFPAEGASVNLLFEDFFKQSSQCISSQCRGSPSTGYSSRHRFR